MLDERLRATIGEAVEARQPELVALIQALVRVPSVTGDEQAVQAVAEAAFRARGLSVDRWCGTDAEVEPYLEFVGHNEHLDRRPNLLGRRTGAGGGRSLLLNAHVDTVPPGERADWTDDPYSGALRDGKLYGRGACDMKGALATYLIALDALAASGVRLKGDVLVSSTVGEEAGGVGALSTVLRGHRADAVVIGEPTDLHLVPAHAGIMPFRLVVPGKSAHAAVRDEGVSAIEKFVPLLQGLQALERERNAALRHPLFAHHANKIPINVGTVQAGVWRSSVPELLVAEGRVGFLPDEDAAAVRAQVAERIQAVAEADPWLREHPPTLTWFVTVRSIDVPVTAPLPRALVAAHRAVTGTDPLVEGKTYAADSGHFLHTGGMPSVLYGAGDIRVAHYANEHIAVADLVTATKVMALLAADWCGVA